MVMSNLDFIAEEAYLRMLAAYPSYTPQADNTAQDCKDDVVSVLKEVMGTLSLVVTTRLTMLLRSMSPTMTTEMVLL